MAGLRLLPHSQLTAAERFSLALGGWVVPVLFLAALLFVVGTIFNLRPSPMVIASLMALTAILAIMAATSGRKKALDRSTLSFWMLTSLFLLLVFLRLAFIARALLPPYFDSATHYQIIETLVRDYGDAAVTNAFVWPVPTYYHLGFHVITAVLAIMTNVNLGSLMLVAGQIVLAAAPIPLFLIVRHETGSNLSGLFAIVLAAFGWYMPAHAANWGKYPALFSLLTIQFSLSIAYLAAGSNPGRQEFLVLVGMVLLAIGTSFLMQTRSPVILGMIFGAWAVARWWERQSAKPHLLILALLLALLVWQIVLLGQNAILQSFLDPYVGSGIFVIGLTGVLAVFAVQKYPRLAFSSLLTISFLLCGLFVPVPGYPYLTLLDRPLVEMLMFVPFALLGGLGCAGLIEYLHDQPNSIRTAGVAVTSVIIAAHASVYYSFYPSSCCSIVKSDDLVALNWIDQNLPSNTTILTATSELLMTTSLPPLQNAGSDAGVWILPLMGRRTVSLPYDTDFGKQDTLAIICDHMVDDIYIGGTLQSFNVKQIDGKPEWYRMILWLPGAKIYHVAGCIH